MENSKQGTIIGKILCFDDDIDEFNKKLNVSTQWWPEEKEDFVVKHSIPFEIIIEKMNSSEVRNLF